MARAGVKAHGRAGAAADRVDAAVMDWVSLSQGLGVPAARVETAEDLTRELERALGEAGPRLIEAVL